MLSASPPSFADAVELTETTAREQVAVADFNGDGIGDVSDGRYVWLGRGDGSFGERLDTPRRIDAAAVVAADFDGDGHADLAATTTYLAGGAGFRLAFMSGNGDGTFELTKQWTSLDLFKTPSATAYTLLDGDFNGDNHTDLLVLPLSTYRSDGLSLLINDGYGRFTIKKVAFETEVLYPQHTDMAVGDVNEDGIDDVVISPGNDGVLVALGQADGDIDFTNAEVYARGYREVSLGDVNGDGHLDLAAKTLDVVPGDEFLQVAISLGRGDRTFDDPLVTELPQPDVASEFTTTINGDYNGDGRDDLAIIGDQWLYILSSAGDGTFGDPRLKRTSVTTEDQLIAADMNADGMTDVVAYGRLIEEAQSLSVFLNTTAQVDAGPVMVGFDKIKPRATEKGKKASFRVVREGNTDRRLKVELSFAGLAEYGRDYKLKARGKAKVRGTKVVIPAGKKAAKFQLVVRDDKRREIDESFQIAIQPTNAISLPLDVPSLRALFAGRIKDND
ncbi:MAG: VCBS repeat-containing protein [Planctomycetota bacterium]